METKKELCCWRLDTGYYPDPFVDSLLTTCKVSSSHDGDLAKQHHQMVNLHMLVP